MAVIGGTTYDTIKEAVKFSSEPFGLIACYLDSNLKIWYFINGKPVVSIEAPKK